MESAVVIYIRELYYPDGFSFPLVMLDERIALVEIIREAATLIMLITIGFIAGRSFTTRFAWFIYSFAVWDIFYYIFLKLLIAWPESFLTWDILFLIPVTWTGPVISPLIVCVYMISLSGLILCFAEKNADIQIHKLEWIMLLSGAIILIVSFTWDYSGYILENYSVSELWNMPGNKSLFELAIKYIPRKFNWSVFTFGSLVIISAMGLYYRRMKAQTNTNSDSLL